MVISKEKIYNIRSKLSSLLFQLEDCNVTNFYTLPNQINKIVIGENKLPSYVNGAIQELGKNDLKHTTTIARYMCRGRSYLKSVSIPDSVVSIEYKAFTECPNLSDVYLYSVTPPINGGAFTYNNNRITFHVPIGSGDIYKSATNWSKYADKIVEDIVIEDTTE